MTRPGIEPGLQPWKGRVLTAWPWGLILYSPSRIRTYDPPVNSRMLYRWAIEDYFKFRQPSTFPSRFQLSIIDRLCLNLRVRYGYGCDPQPHYHRKFFISLLTSYYLSLFNCLLLLLFTLILLLFLSFILFLLFFSYFPHPKKWTKRGKSIKV